MSIRRAEQRLQALFSMREDEHGRMSPPCTDAETGLPSTAPRIEAPNCCVRFSLVGTCLVCSCVGLGLLAAGAVVLHDAMTPAAAETRSPPIPRPPPPEEMEKGRQVTSAEPVRCLKLEAGTWYLSYNDYLRTLYNSYLKSIINTGTSGCRSGPGRFIHIRILNLVVPVVLNFSTCW